MKYGLDIPVNGEYANPRTLAVLAAEAERAGWDGFFVQDVFLGTDAILDPWVTLSAIAVQTQRIRLGVMLTPLARRRPWESRPRDRDTGPLVEWASHLRRWIRLSGERFHSFRGRTK